MMVRQGAKPLYINTMPTISSQVISVRIMCSHKGPLVLIRERLSSKIISLVRRTITTNSLLQLTRALPRFSTNQSATTSNKRIDTRRTKYSST